MHTVRSDDLAGERLQVPIVERSIEQRTRVDDASIDSRADRDARRPVLGGQRQVERPQVHVGHRDEPPLGERAAPAVAILETDRPQQHAAPEIQLLAVSKDLHRSGIEPVFIGDAKLEREPIGRFTRSSFSTTRPAISVASRL
jgi:hypothetical protein